MEFLHLTKTLSSRPNETRIPFWAAREQVDRVAKIVGEAAAKPGRATIWPEYSPGYYAQFFEDPDGRSWNVLLSATQSLRTEADQGRLRVSHSTADLKILRPQNRVRYLKLIALFKIGKGILLLVLGISILFLNSRAVWMDNISDWVADEILLQHGKVIQLLT